MQAAAEPMRKPPKMDESDVGLVTGDIKKLESEANRLGRLINDSFKAYFNSCVDFWLFLAKRV